MPETTAPADVVRAVLDGVSRLVTVESDRAEQIERLVARYAESTHVTHPMSSDVPPLRDRDDLRRHFAEGPGRIGPVDGFVPADVTLHETGDPEVVVAEFHYEITRNGTTRDIPAVFVTRVRDGLIVESHDHIVTGAPD